MEVNIDAENGYLGCVLKKGSLIKETKLQEKHFYSDGNRALFNTLVEIADKGEHIDIVAILTTMNQNALHNIGGKAYLSKLINGVASTAASETYEKYIINAWKIRAVHEITNKKITDPVQINNVITQLTEIEHEDQEEEYNHKESLIKLYEQSQMVFEGLTGIDTGYNDLNKFLDGFQNTDLIVSAARPSMGKTAKALNHMIHACEKDNAVVAFFSLEMGKQQLLNRLISTIGRINGAKLKNPVKRFNDNDWGKYHSAHGILGDKDLYIYDEAGQTVNKMRSRIAKLRKKYTDRKMLVIIDYLQLIRSDKGTRFDNKNNEIGEITRSLKEIAKTYNLPVYLLSQLSRGVEQRQDKRPMMSDLRDSGSIEQDADVVEFLYREDYYDAGTEMKNVIEVIIAKQRNGPVGTVELAYMREFNLMYNIER